VASQSSQSSQSSKSSQSKAKPAAVPGNPKPPAQRDDRQPSRQVRAKQAEATRPLRNEVQQIDQRLARLGKEKAEVERTLANPATAPESFAELGRNLSHISAEIAMLEERWLALQTELETLSAG
jgi:ATP-binding cassette subfamily F protein 3